jgi:hypothetical protein
METRDTRDHESGPRGSPEKKRRDALLELARQNRWEIGDLDEVWWSRLSQPNLHRWSEEDEPLRVQERSKEDPDPKALACSGMLAVPSGRMHLRVVSGRPVSQVTADVLAWLCERVQAQGTHVLLRLWENTSWHVSTPVRTWLREHNRTVLREARTSTQGVRSVPCWLPTTRPWLTRREPTGVHGTRAIVEPARTLSACELCQRVCDSFDREPTELLAQKVA